MRSSTLNTLLRHFQFTKKRYNSASFSPIFTTVINPTLLVHEAQVPCSNLMSNCQRRQFSTNQEEERNNINDDSGNDVYQDDMIQPDNSIVFPWRESAITPLPRVISNDNLSGLNMSSYNKFALKLACCVELRDFSFWNFFITRQWEKDLAYNASWAFQMAVAGLVSRTFGVPLDSIENTIEEGLIVDTSDSAIKARKEHKENETDDNNIGNDEETNGLEETSTFIQNMIEENLLSLYKPISSSSSKNIVNNYEVTILLKPLTSRLENIFMIPSLTRQDVNLNPSLKGAYSAIDKAYTEKKSIEDIHTMSRELFRKTPHFGSKRSLIMDVSIDCAEIFQIKDLANGKIIQGLTKDDLEPERTTHLVRFEMVTSKGSKKGDRVLGSWTIIDIDDRLNGNKWH